MKPPLLTATTTSPMCTNTPAVIPSWPQATELLLGAAPAVGPSDTVGFRLVRLAPNGSDTYGLAASRLGSPLTLPEPKLKMFMLLP